MKAKEQARLQNLGMFNVVVTVYFKDKSQKELDVHKWVDTPLALALTLDDCLMIIPHDSIKYFEVRAQIQRDENGEIVN